MNNIIIEVERKTGKSFCENNKIGVQHSNLQNKIIYKLDEMINGVAWLEYEIDGRKHFAEMDAIDMGYQIDIKSCLLVSDYVNVDLKITENENANGIPIFVSTITELDVYESIGASDEEPEEYPSWLDEANAKIDEITTLDNTILQHENIRVQNETTRVQNENERISNENQRVISENQRVTSEETRLSNEETRINNDIARETRIENLENNKADKTEIPDVSSFINKNVNDLINYELKTNTGSLISLNINSSNYVITIQLKNSDGTVISTDTIDLPLESVVVGGRYDNNTKKIILTLENGNVVDFSVADLVSGLQTEITSNNMLESDLVDDSNSGHKFVSASEKNNWNGKQDKLKAGNNISIENNVINATDTTYDVSNSSKDGLMSKSDKSKLDSINVNNLELKSNKVTEISNTSTNDEYPGAKCVYDSQESQNTLIKDLQTENSTLKNIVNNIYDLENILPNETEESDEDISFNNTMNKAPLNITLKGNTEQITYSGKNLFNKDGEFGQGFLGDAGEVVYSAQSVTLIDYIPVEQNKSYTCSYDVIVDGSQFRGVAYYDTNKTFISRSTPSGSFTTPTNTAFIRMYFYNPNDMSVEQLPSYIQNIQLEQGSSATDYEPYVGGTASPNPDYPQDIRVVKDDNTINIIGKNLFDKNNVNVLNGYITSTKISGSSETRTIYIPCRSNTNYTISRIQGARFRVATTTDTPTINANVSDYIGNDTATSITVTTDSEANYLCVFLYHSAYDTLTYQQIINSLQIEQGSTATTYSSYISKTYPINLGNIELCKIGDYQDYIYKDSGKWYLHSAIQKITLNGTQTINQINTTQTNTTRVMYQNISPNSISNNASIFCNRLSGVIMWSNDVEGIYTNDSAIVFRINKSTIGTTETNVNTYLSSNNIILYYPLATPTDTEITDTELINQLNQLYNAYSYHKQTNIYQNSCELPFYLNVKAMKEI